MEECPLTLFVIPSGNPNHDRPFRAGGSYASRFFRSQIHVLGDCHIWEFDVFTKWYSFIYSNEWLDKNLCESLVHFLTRDDFDFYVLAKRVNDKGTVKYFYVPRIFRKYIKLEEEGLTPIGHEDLNCEKILNGWVMEDVRN